MSEQGIDLDTSSKRLRILGSIVLFLFATACFFAFFSPFSVTSPDFGLDASWTAVLGDARSHGLSIGKDIIFTVGPLSSLYTRWFDPDLFEFHVVLKLWLIISIALMIATLAKRSDRIAVAFILCLVPFTAIEVRDAIFFCIPVLTGLVAISSQSHKVRYAIVLMGLIATAITALAKFSTVPLAVAVFLAADLVLGVRRRLPLLTVTFLAFAFGLYSLLEGSEKLIPFIYGSFVFAGGYADAMGAPGSITELLSFLCVAASSAAAMMYYEFVSIRGNRTSWLEAVARCLIISLMVFVSFKGGFVRQDLHTVTAWSGIAIAGLIYVLVAPPLHNHSKRKWVLAAIFGLSSLCAFLAIPLAWGMYGRSLSQSYEHWEIEMVRSFDLAKNYIADPASWIDEKKFEKDNAWAVVRGKLPLPKLDGTVDTIPSIQSSILAHGLNYHPRWSFQDYATYAPPLIERNNVDIIKQGPKYILFDPALTNIDERYPALADGSLWPELLRLYRPVRQAESVVVLQRREGDVPSTLLGPVSSADIGFGKALPIPAGAPQFMKVSIDKTILGKLASVLFRPSIIHMRVTFDDGGQGVFRIIPAMAKSGFIISPYIATSDDYGAMVLSRTTGLRRVSQVAFETGRLGALLYRQTIEVGLQPIQLDEASLKDDPGLRNYANERHYMFRLRTSPGTSVIPEGLLSHAPNTIATTVDWPTSSLVVKYGIVDAALQQPGGTDGVCFLVSLRRGETISGLFKRCLAPVQNKADRGQQSSQIDADLKVGDIIQLETACRETCANDWSYWSQIIAK